MKSGWNDGLEKRNSNRNVEPNKLRIVTDKNFGYDPDGNAEENEQAIAAWEEWFKSSGEIKVTPDAELVAIPERVEEAEK